MCPPGPPGPPGQPGMSDRMLITDSTWEVMPFLGADGTPGTSGQAGAPGPDGEDVPLTPQAELPWYVRI